MNGALASVPVRNISAALCIVLLIFKADILICHTTKTSGKTNVINSASRLASMSQHAQYQGPGTSLPKWNAVVLMISITPVFFLLLQDKMFTVKEVFYLSEW